MEQWFEEQLWAMLPGAIGLIAWLVFCGFVGFVGAFLIVLRNGEMEKPTGFLRWWGVLGGGLFALGFFGFNALRLVGFTVGLADTPS